MLHKLESQLGWAASQQSQFYPPVGKMYHATIESNQMETGVLLKRFQPDRYYDLSSPTEWVFEFDPARERARSGGNPNCFWNMPADQSILNVGEQKGCEITEFGCNRFVAQVSADRPMMLGVLSAPDLGWKARVAEISHETNQVSESTEVKLIRSADWNRDFASEQIRWNRLNYDDILLLPIDKPGQFEIEFVYSPVEFWVGMWISLLAWISLVVGIVVFLRREQYWKTHRKSGSLS